MRCDRLRLASGACLSLLLGLAPLPPALGDPPPAQTQTSASMTLRQVQAIVTNATQPPAANDPRWHDQPLTHALDGPSAWYRLHFDAPAPPASDADGPPMVYLPYFYGGGQFLLNGQPAAEVPHSTAQWHVRWERPLLLPLPPAALKAEGNALLIHAFAEHQGHATVLPAVEIGPQRLLQPAYERRLLFVRTLPILTWVSGTVVGLLVLLIWLKRREERLYGLFGLAAVLWAQRTSTFVLETFSATAGGGWDAWNTWRLAYHLCTGGFVVGMTLFALNLAGWSRRRLTHLLLAYWAVGPLIFLGLGEGSALQAWQAGIVLLALGLLAAALAAAWKQPTADTLALAAVVVASVLAGVHDQLLASSSPWLLEALPQWSGHRLFLLHHAANLLLLVMGVLLALRFVRSLNAVEEANRTLEARVQQREREIAANYEHIAALQRERAAIDERQRIMRDLHDGLGSQLFTSLSRAERGAMDRDAMTDSLRGAIDQMRVAIEALASEEQDFEAAFGNFRFRWDARLREAGIAPHWDVVLPQGHGDAPLLEPHQALQLMHIVQEALTNVVKHARATQVSLRLRLHEGELALDIADNGLATAASAETDAEGGARPGGRGKANMRSRAQRLGGRIEWLAQDGGLCVQLRAPIVPPPLPPTR